MGRFKDYGIPPGKNGDYAYLLHIISSLKSKGKGACILPHGVLFRGNAEAEIRMNIIARGYIKGIIGLPPNLFYGTGIPASIIVIDKERAASRKGIFMIDAGKGFVKDGNKNRLRDMDIHKIVDVFNKRREIDGYSKMASFVEIEKNEYNLNIPRYIDSRETEDIQDIEAHLKGGVPKADIEALNEYWKVCPNLKNSLFTQSKGKKHCAMKVDKHSVGQTVFNHPEFKAFTEELGLVFSVWKTQSVHTLKNLSLGFDPKKIIFDYSKSLLENYTSKSLISKYDVYQRLMDYWNETMQDDCYLIAANGWKAETYRILVENKNKKIVDKGWTCDLTPKDLVINCFFLKEKQAIATLEAENEKLAGQLAELEEEHNGEDGALSVVGNKTDAQKVLDEYIRLAWKSYFPDTFRLYESEIAALEYLESELLKVNNDDRIKELANNRGNITQKAVKDRLKYVEDNFEKALLDSFLKITGKITAKKKIVKELFAVGLDIVTKKATSDTEAEYSTEIMVVKSYLEITGKMAENKKALKEANEELDEKLYAKYPVLTEDEIKTLVVDDKWMTSLGQSICAETDGISQKLAQRIKNLAERYEKPLPEMESEVKKLEGKVAAHLEKMGFVWK